MEHSRVLKLLDRIAYHGTTDTDLIQSVAGFRRMLNGKAPSELLDAPAPSRKAAKHKSYTASQAEIEKLKARLKDVENEKATSERHKQRQIESLVAQIAQMQDELERRQASWQPAERPHDGFYTRAQVAQIIVSLFEKDHGVKKALVEKNACLRRDDPSLPKITDSLWQTWRKKDQYPEWVIEQLRLLTPDDFLTTHKWTPEQKQHARQLFLTGNYTNEQLAAECSKRFGCKLTDSSIRGLLHREGLRRS